MKYYNMKIPGLGEGGVVFGGGSFDDFKDALANFIDNGVKSDKKVTGDGSKQPIYLDDLVEQMLFSEKFEGIQFSAYDITREIRDMVNRLHLEVDGCDKLPGGRTNIPHGQVRAIVHEIVAGDDFRGTLTDKGYILYERVLDDDDIFDDEDECYDDEEGDFDPFADEDNPFDDYKKDAVNRAYVKKGSDLENIPLLSAVERITLDSMIFLYAGSGRKWVGVKELQSELKRSALTDVSVENIKRAAERLGFKVDKNSMDSTSKIYF